MRAENLWPDTFSGDDWIFMTGSVVLLTAGPVFLVRYWKDLPYARNPFISQGQDFYRRKSLQGAQIRTGAVQIVAAIVWGAAMGLIPFSGTSEVLEGVIALAFLSAVAVGAVLSATIILFNKPKSFVPPDLRDQIGALAARSREESRPAPENRGGSPWVTLMLYSAQIASVVGVIVFFVHHRYVLAGLALVAFAGLQFVTGHYRDVVRRPR
jgi:hypothetical protein